MGTMTKQFAETDFGATPPAAETSPPAPAPTAETPATPAPAQPAPAGTHSTARDQGVLK